MDSLRVNVLIHFCKTCEINTSLYFWHIVLRVSRSSSNSPISNIDHSSDDALSEKQVIPERKSVIPSNCRYMYPEFLPDPKMEWRNSLREKLERMDMIQRRKNIDIPEFYVGR